MVKIRLRRMGARNRPFYRVVVSDSRKVPTAPAIEELGHYDPLQTPAVIELDREKIDHWVARGAQLSPTVKKLLVGYRPSSERRKDEKPAEDALEAVASAEVAAVEEPAGEAEAENEVAVAEDVATETEAPAEETSS
jgi:small subunit ribosomal protein S16